MFSGGGLGAQTGLVQSILGSGSSAISSTLSQKLGFNVAPLVNLAVPLVVGLLGKTVKAQGTDASGLSKLLLAENDTFMKNPANKETAGLVFSALSAGDKARALRDSFDEAEWLRVRLGPAAALYHVASASPSGPLGLMKEFSAAADAVTEATKDVPAVSLIGAAFGEGLRKEDLERFSREHPSTDELLADIKNGFATVARKSPADARAYREMVLSAAQRAAEATREGGFLGIGGTKVSEKEQRALDDIRSALS
jgi:hypothetical protein